MDRFQLIAFGSFLLVAGIYGLRLLRRGALRRELPEILASIAMLCLGPLGYGCISAARAPGLLPSEFATPLTVIGVLSLSAGAAALFLLVMHAFRPDSLLARWIGYTALALLCVSSVGDVMERVLAHLHGGGVLTWTASGVRLMAIAWSAVEALYASWSMRKRVALGLMDPVLAGQVGLWGSGMMAIAGAFAISFGVRFATGQSFMSHPTWSLVISMLAMTAALLFALAFFPPMLYQRWLRAGGAASS